MLTEAEILKRYVELHRLYIDTPKKDIIREAETLIGAGMYKAAEAKMAVLATKEQLLESLFTKLRGKPVASTLRDVLEGRCKNLYGGLKGMMSLGTHLCIELEKGNMEYKPLLEDVLASIHKQMV